MPTRRSSRSSSENRPHLQLVRSPSQPAPTSPTETAPPSFFIVDMHVVNRFVFIDFLRDMKPTTLFDLRPCASFLLDGAFSRMYAFAYFEHYNIRYLDAADALEIVSRDASSASGRVAEFISSTIAKDDNPPTSVGILVNTKEALLWESRRLYDAIVPAPSGGWVAHLIASRESLISAQRALAASAAVMQHAPR